MTITDTFITTHSPFHPDHPVGGSVKVYIGEEYATGAPVSFDLGSPGGLKAEQWMTVDDLRDLHKLIGERLAEHDAAAADKVDAAMRAEQAAGA